MPGTARRKGWYVVSAAATATGLYTLLGLKVWDLPWLEIAFFGWVIFAFPVTFWASVAFAQPPPRRVFGAGGAKSILVGGAQWSVFGIPWHATWPFARLELMDVGLRIGGLLVPTWDLEWRDLQSVQMSRGKMRIRLAASPDHPITIFSTRRDMASMAVELNARQVPIN